MARNKVHRLSELKVMGKSGLKTKHAKEYRDVLNSGILDLLGGGVGYSVGITRELYNRFEFGRFSLEVMKINGSKKDYEKIKEFVNNIKEYIGERIKDNFNDYKEDFTSKVKEWSNQLGRGLYIINISLGATLNIRKYESDKVDVSRRYIKEIKGKKTRELFIDEFLKVIDELMEEVGSYFEEVLKD